MSYCRRGWVLMLEGWTLTSKCCRVENKKTNDDTFKACKLNMTSDEQTMMDALSRSVTALCEAIDPTSEHGPETDKIIAWETEIRGDMKLLLINLYDRAFQGDEPWAQQVLDLVNKLGWTKEIRESLWRKPKPKAPNAQAEARGD